MDKQETIVRLLQNEKSRTETLGILNRKLTEELEKAAQLVNDYEEANEDKKRICREIGVVLFGEAGAPKQPALCDIQSYVTDLKRNYDLIKKS